MTSARWEAHDPHTDRWFDAGLAIALLYFVARGIYFALSIGPGVPPDEAHHFESSLYFAKTLELPTDSSESHPLGLNGRAPLRRRSALRRSR